MRGTAMLLVFLTALVGGWQNSASETTDARMLRLSDHRTLSLSKILPDLKSVSVVLMGEVHSNRAHHEAEQQLIQALHESGADIAVGLEMFPRTDQKVLDDWVKGDLDEEELKKVFLRDWGFPWDLYRDIFLYARKQSLPLVALNVDREISAQIAREGFNSLSKEQLAKLPEVTCDVSPAYENYLRRALGEHAHGGFNYRHFCEAQLFWDAAMAVGTLDYLNAHPSKLVVVLAGDAHAWKPGIPRQLRTRSNVSFRSILPETPERITPETVSTEDADYLWLGL